MVGQTSGKYLTVSLKVEVILICNIALIFNANEDMNVHFKKLIKLSYVNLSNLLYRAVLKYHFN